MVLDRILRGDHQKGLRQAMRVAVHRHLALVHRLEQRGLRLGSGAVDLVGQQDVGEHRPGLELEALLAGRVDGDAHHVAGQHVAGELDALEGAVQAAGQRVRQRGLAHARNALDQQVPAREQRHQRQPDDFVCAANHPPQRAFELHRALHGFRSCCEKPFCLGLYQVPSTEYRVPSTSSHQSCRLSDLAWLLGTDYLTTVYDSASPAAFRSGARCACGWADGSRTGRRSSSPSSGCTMNRCALEGEAAMGIRFE